jgi:hypothetical protein
MIDSTRYPRLARIESPADLKRVPETGLRDISRQIRFRQTLRRFGGRARTADEAKTS